MVKNSFDRGPESWCSYDYHASMVADGTNIFILATWAAKGGVGDSGYVWTDHRRWSAVGQAGAVQADPVAELSAEQAVGRQAGEFAGQVPQGDLDAAQGGHDQAVEGVGAAQAGLHRGEEAVHVEGVLADQEGFEQLVDYGSEARAPVGFT